MLLLLIFFQFSLIFIFKGLSFSSAIGIYLINPDNDTLLKFESKLVGVYRSYLF